MAFELPDLGYDYDALEPHLDGLTMEIHHSKHHNAYTNNLNAAIAGTEMEGKSIEDLLANHTEIIQQLETMVVDFGIMPYFGI